MTETVHRICPLCEANCGLTLTIDRTGGGRVESARGDKNDVFSSGFICPKGVSFGDLHTDPDRLRAPLVRNESGELTPTTWDHAFDVIQKRLGSILHTH